MESKQRHPVNLKQYRKINGKWQFVPVARDAKGNPGPRLVLVDGELNRHQTAVSRSAERVESGIGVELFDRTSYPIRLTKAGVVFFYWVGKGMDALERAIVEGVRASQPEASVLQVGCLLS